jgi:low affinity Fe/Cu permease
MSRAGSERPTSKRGRRKAEPLPRTIDGMTRAFGHPVAVAIALVIVAAWVIGLPFVGASSTTYQLLINTGTTIVTFVMVFAIQHTTNKETRAIMMKLDELIRAMPRARDSFIGIEEESDGELKSRAERERALHPHAPPSGTSAPDRPRTPSV